MEEKMEVRIMSDKFCLTSSLREHLDRRLQFSFSGVHNNILLVVVRLRDLNGPRGGSDMMCQIHVTIPGCPQIVIKEVQEDMYGAIDLTVRRSAYRAQRLLSQKRQLKKRGRVLLPVMQLKGA
jgi:putative sigma-54 modulation protein